MNTKKLATITAALLISVAPAAAIINQPVHTVQAATQLQKVKLLSRNLLTAQFKSSTAKAMPLPLPKKSMARR